MHNSPIVRLAVAVSMMGSFVFGWVGSYFTEVVHPTLPLIVVACVAGTILAMWSVDNLLDK
jgi:hypothetical protein